MSTYFIFKLKGRVLKNLDLVQNLHFLLLYEVVVNFNSQAYHLLIITRGQSSSL